MAYSSLKRKTPLRSKGGFKPRVPLHEEHDGCLPPQGDRSASKAKERPAAARKSSRSSLETHLDIVFSLFIRLRDAMDGGMSRCVSCGRLFPFEQIQCGHYFTRHNRSVRWDEHNCSSQCAECNCNKRGNLEAYTPNLIAKIGREAFDALCVRAREERKWSGEELRSMIKHYKAEVRRLSKEKGIIVKI